MAVAGASADRAVCTFFHSLEKVLMTLFVLFTEQPVATSRTGMQIVRMWSWSLAAMTRHTLLVSLTSAPLATSNDGECEYRRGGCRGLVVTGSCSSLATRCVIRRRNRRRSASHGILRMAYVLQRISDQRQTGRTIVRHDVFQRW